MSVVSGVTATITGHDSLFWNLNHNIVITLLHHVVCGARRVKSVKSILCDIKQFAERVSLR